jgi:hypothetical protein
MIGQTYTVQLNTLPSDSPDFNRLGLDLDQLQFSMRWEYR